ncbi:MAG: glycoside hydrolase family 3 C-terminal domain-containing protein, partial [Bacteroidales bacterium]|nr:glycoside hydrolase family 3 C-terminal domain-containing protein [Bacteroidales bacterium]
LHGVARAGRATSFPQAIGMAATWNPELIHQVADAISSEARAKFNMSIKKGQRNRYQGLTMWTPNINIFRDPRWGRGQETYGEDPYLTSRLGVAFVKGLQGDDSKYLKVVATPKHYAVHSGPEFNRHSFDAYTNKKDLWETYLPAFEATVVEGKAFSVMSAYNRYLGSSATASKLLLTDILRDKWGFEGYVVSDCGAVFDIYKYHKIVKTAEEASALAVTSGCDLNCGNSYQSLLIAVEKNLIAETDIDVALTRLLMARMKLGLFNLPQEVPFLNIDESYLESKKHQDLALKTARESIVLLKNENNTLPISKDIKSLVVIGPMANDRHFLLGNYFGVPSELSTIYEVIDKNISKDTELHYFKGVNITDDKPIFDVVAAQYYSEAVKIEYFNNSDFQGEAVLTAESNSIDFEWGGAAPIPIVKPGKFSVRYSTSIRVQKDMDIDIAVQENGGSYKLYVDDKLFISGNSTKDKHLKLRELSFIKGQAYQIRIDYSNTNPWVASVQLKWNLEEVQGEQYMMEVVSESDMVVYIGGISARLEGEEMPIEIEGFHKGDRTNLQLPVAQKKLMKKLHETGKPMVFVMTSGSALAINWADENIEAILASWYPGQAGGQAIYDVLFGDYNPSGKLPITFYKSVDDLPHFEDYSMKGRTYRYFQGEVLYPFGYGLTYTDFEYSKPMILDQGNVPVRVFIEVSNIGDFNGEAVV